jgi:hypothetical protein
VPDPPLGGKPSAVAAVQSARMSETVAFIMLAWRDRSLLSKRSFRINLQCIGTWNTGQESWRGDKEHLNNIYALLTLREIQAFWSLLVSKNTLSTRHQCETRTALEGAYILLVIIVEIRAMTSTQVHSSKRRSKLTLSSKQSVYQDYCSSQIESLPHYFLTQVVSHVVRHLRRGIVAGEDLTVTLYIFFGKG